MKNTYCNGLYWFAHDLRLSDNEALARFCQTVDRAIFVFVIDPRWFKASHFQSQHMGKHRWLFLKQSLQAVDAQLRAHGNALHVQIGYPSEVIADLISQHQIQVLAGNRFSGFYEKQQWRHICKRFPVLETIVENGHTLFAEEDLPFALEQLPSQFTPFRKAVEAIAVKPLSTPPKHIPALPNGFEVADGHIQAEHYWSLKNESNTLLFHGGSCAGLDRLDYYLHQSQKILTYKETRNGLDEFDDSSKLSPWLANGSLSVRQVYHTLKQFELDVTSNGSTYWLYFELLWREYFHWYLEKHGAALFRFKGVKNKSPITSFWPERFQKWCSGNTPYPIVNACMRQLNATGYMSNRGRQIVASCLVHELQLDWRYGAAYFEQQLVDFDVAANWGNWQYLAGVGADPRGHRKFDLDKQTNAYDPDRLFIKKWQGDVGWQPLDSTDMVDWPIQWH